MVITSILFLCWEIEAHLEGKVKKAGGIEEWQNFLVQKNQNKDSLNGEGGAYEEETCLKKKGQNVGIRRRRR